MNTIECESNAIDFRSIQNRPPPWLRRSASYANAASCIAIRRAKNFYWLKKKSLKSGRIYAYVCSSYCRAIPNAKNRVVRVRQAKRKVTTLDYWTADDRPPCSRTEREGCSLSLKVIPYRGGGGVDRLSTVYRLAKILSHAIEKFNLGEWSR